jgi:GNAT superfamily N-acetyltransferase
MRVVHRKYKEYHSNERRALKYAALEGGMFCRLIRLLPDFETISVWDKRGLMGWAIAWSPEDYTLFQMYVNPRYRGRGVASLLVCEGIKKYKNITLSKWDGTTNEIFHHFQKKHPSQVNVIRWWKFEDRYVELLKKGSSQRKEERP